MFKIRPGHVAGEVLSAALQTVAAVVMTELVVTFLSEFRELQSVPMPGAVVAAFIITLSIAYSIGAYLQDGIGIKLNAPVWFSAGLVTCAALSGVALNTASGYGFIVGLVLSIFICMAVAQGIMLVFTNDELVTRYTNAALLFIRKQGHRYGVRAYLLTVALGLAWAVTVATGMDSIRPAYLRWVVIVVALLGPSWVLWVAMAMEHLERGRMSGQPGTHQ